MSALTAQRRKEIATLHRRKHRVRLGQFLIEGIRAVEAAVAADAPLAEVIAAEAAARDARVKALLDRVKGTVHVLPEHQVEKLSAVETSQGVLAVARLEQPPPEDLPAYPALLALDGVQDPGNVGTLLRTAAWFGVGAVLAGPGTADFYSPKVVRAGMGSHWDLALAQTDDLAHTLGEFRARGVHLYGADLDGLAAPAWQPTSPAVLVLGSEAHGLSPSVRACVDACVAIPGAPRRQGTESLNVSIAGGILLYAWVG